QGESKSEPHPTPAPTAEETSEEPEATVTWGADVDLVSKYIWRGENLNNDVSIQPNIWVSAYGFTASGWFQLATKSNEDEAGDTHTPEEIDLTLAYEHSFDKITAGAGLIHYAYPGFDVDSTNEFYVTGSYDTTIAPSVGIYRDVDVKSWYLEFG